MYVFVTINGFLLMARMSIASITFLGLISLGTCVHKIHTRSVGCIVVLPLSDPRVGPNMSL